VSFDGFHETHGRMQRLAELRMIAPNERANRFFNGADRSSEKRFL
jgi:hypothetical protein